MQEAGSFRDRSARIFYQDGRVFRTMSDEALKNFRAISAIPFFSDAMKRASIVRTQEVPMSSVSIPGGVGRWAGVLEHERIPFVSYPYEWSFGMLKDAALLHLDLMQMALDADFIPKDSSAYNIQFRGARPVFIDIASFEPVKAAELWVGYRQFCQMFLFPLMLQCYRHVPFQTWMRGNIDGIDVPDIAGLMTFRDLFRPGVFKHVYLHSKLQAHAKPSQTSIKVEIEAIGFHKEMIKANVSGLRKIIEKLCLPVEKSVWVNYAEDNSYPDNDAQAKKVFIEEVVKQKRRPLIWDLGCNAGVFSRLASKNSNYVIAMDYDHATVERLYSELKSEESDNILPLVVNLANPSPNHGWRGLERKDLISRGKPDLVLALALIHHIVIAANIPLKEFVGWLGSLKSELVIEFITKDDEMVKTLLANKEDNYSDYNQELFEDCMRKYYTIERKIDLKSGKRALYHCCPLQ